MLSNLSKIFTGIINKRIVLWSESKGFLSECQAGFRQKKSTVDQMFILKTMIDRFLFRKRGRVYCIFVDFSKAFDTVNRNYLFYSLIKSGMHGKMLRTVPYLSGSPGREKYDRVLNFFHLSLTGFEFLFYPGMTDVEFFFKFYISNFFNRSLF